MRIVRPFTLELEYQRQMMAALLFLPRPRHVVQLGLGAAALAKFCWRELPDAVVSAVEISDAVVAAAHQWFRLPAHEARLEVVLADAREFIAHPRRRRYADWLQVDLYDAAARGPVYDDDEFYRACRAALRWPGIAVFNLFGCGFDAGFATIARVFEDRALVLPEVDAGNRIVLAFAGAPLAISARTLQARAAQIERRFRLPARAWLAGLLLENGLAGDGLRV